MADLASLAQTTFAIRILTVHVCQLWEVAESLILNLSASSLKLGWEWKMHYD